MRTMKRILQQDESTQQAWLTEANQAMQEVTAEERVQQALSHFPVNAVVSSSFGAQAAVMLHLLSRQREDIPVILLDTGYLFAETYRFADELQQRLQLNLKVYRAPLSAAWQEARWGQLWTEKEGLQRYNQLNKVEPMQRALKELNAGTWFSGLRRQQSRTRQQIPFAERHTNVIKVHPIADWSDRDIYNYLERHQLPYHPLWHKGYVSIGDTHSTQRLDPGMNPEDTRFNGMGRECGLHT
ncbi:phosphoadenosine phosphosulfate reductase [Aliidiomarina minuta]|uniref:Phosphoadenosine 5'-phosphosulfate reductase n=1 Tax=Aliidiomarina minuta TaxID=880057 RepID=A0A432W1A6_9GAMM|nr:phosphoadenylyl-sulfate reductase [Aliidiomarina minuta]RUO22906.1 phosphoadenosine phosphosulfate reductase [Aliidiomarina minuta]